MAPTTENRQFSRIRFYEGVNVSIVSEDGTRRHDCKMVDVSLRGCRLVLKAPIDGIPAKHFLLVLSESDAVYRRCKRMWVRGEQIGVRFLTDVQAIDAAQRNKGLKAEG